MTLNDPARKPCTMQTCTVTIREPDLDELRCRVGEDDLTDVLRRYCYKEIELFEECRRYAILRNFAIRSCASSIPSRDGRISLDAGLDPMRFSVIFPDTKGRGLSAEERIRLMKEDLRGKWMLSFGFHKRTPVGTKSEAFDYVQNYLFGTMLSISELRPVSATWQELLEKGREADERLHREAFCFTMPSALSSGHTSTEAILWSRTDRIMHLAPPTIRRAWDGEGFGYRRTLEKLGDLGIESLVSEVPTWALAEGLSPLGTSVRDLLRVTLERNWKKGSREVEEVLDRARAAIYFGLTNRVERWCSSASFADGLAALSRLEPEPSKPVYTQDLSGESLFW